MCGCERLMRCTGRGDGWSVDASVELEVSMSKLCSARLPLRCDVCSVSTVSSGAGGEFSRQVSGERRTWDGRRE